MTLSLEDLLSRDPLLDAEKITGYSYKESEATTWLGMFLGMKYSEEKRSALEKVEDTTFSSTLDRYVEVVDKNGFRCVLCIPFKSGEADEEFFVFFHDDGLLLAFDTYRGKVNRSKVYYNWDPNKGAKESGEYYRYISSGGFKGDVWCGDHDGREALLLKLNRLREHGSFVSPWKNRPWLWLLHHGDEKVPNYSYEEINKERIAMLPADVQEAISPEGS